MCHFWTGVCPSSRLGAEAVVPVSLQVAASRAASATAGFNLQSQYLCPSGCVCCCCRCCSHHQLWLIKLDNPSSKSSPCSLVLSYLHLYSSSCCLVPALFPSLPIHLLFVPSASSTPPLDTQLLGRGTFPLPGSRCCGGEVGSEAGGWVSVCLSLSRSRLWARARRASLPSLHAIQPALSAGR